MMMRRLGGMHTRSKEDRSPWSDCGSLRWLMDTGAWHQAWINIFVTTVLCLCLCFLGMAVGRLLLSAKG